jgi:hypothetical protein
MNNCLKCGQDVIHSDVQHIMFFIGSNITIKFCVKCFYSISSFDFAKDKNSVYDFGRYIGKVAPSILTPTYLDYQSFSKIFGKYWTNKLKTQLQGIQLP